MKTKIKNLLLLLLLLGLPGVVQAQVNYAVSGNTAYVASSPNASGNVVITNIYDGYPVTSIGFEAFENDTSLTSVTIPNSVTSIAQYAFLNCSGLTSVTIGNSVTSIGDYAFSYCSGLTSVTIPNSVTSIGLGAFEYCSDLTSVTIPNSVTNISNEAFLACSGLTSVTIPNSVTSIGDGAFVGDGLTSVTIPASVTNIGDSAFGYCSGLTSVTIPNSVTSIGGQAFQNCSSLTSVTIGNSVTSIGGEAFADTSLTSVTIPNSVTSIGDDAFIYCYSLTSVTIGNSVTNISEGAFAFCPDLTSVTIPNSVTSIGYEVFEDCGLTSVTIPNSVTSIGEGAFIYCYGLTSVTIPDSVTSIGEEAFAFCSDLTNINVATDNPAYSSVNGVLFDKSQATLIQYPIGLPNTSYAIPNSVTSIGDEAFEECSGLTSVTIGNSVTNIGEYAFEGCYSLTNAYFQGNAPTVDGVATTVFDGETGTAYYLPGTSAWGSTFGGWPTAQWYQPQPQILNHSAGFGIQPGGFGFTISWATNASVVVQAATNLANPVWIPVSTNTTLTGGTNYFSDPQWTNYPLRFYRVTGAFTVGGTLTGLPAGDTVTLQDNGGDDLTLSANGTFTFPTALPNGQSYSVTVSGTSGRTPPNITLTSGSGTISGANVTNVAVQCSKCPEFTGNMDVDMYNAAVSDGTANGGVPAVMVTENGGPFRVTARGFCSDNVALKYSGQCVVAQIVGTTSCSSTTLPSGATVIQFGTALACGPGPYGY